MQAYNQIRDVRPPDIVGPDGTRFRPGRRVDPFLNGFATLGSYTVASGGETPSNRWLVSTSGADFGGTFNVNEFQRVHGLLGGRPANDRLGFWLMNVRQAARRCVWATPDEYIQFQENGAILWRPHYNALVACGVSFHTVNIPP